MNEAKAEESCISYFGCGCLESGQMWSEYKNDYLNADFEKAFKIDDISSVFHYNLVTDDGGLNSYLTGEKKGEPRCGDFGGMLTEDKIVNLHSTGNLLKSAEDYILDVDFSKKVPELDYQCCEEWSFRNSSSEIHSPATSNEVVRVSEPSNTVLKFIKNEAGKSTYDGIHDFCDSKCKSEVLVEDEMALNCSLTYDLLDVHEPNDSQNPFEIDRSLCTSIKNSCLLLSSSKASCTSTYVEYDEVCPVNEDEVADELLMNDRSTDGAAEENIALSRIKRLSKPPKRYIDGSASSKSRSYKARKFSSNLSQNKGLRVQCQQKHHSIASQGKAAKVIESNSELDSDEEYDPLPSHFNVRKAKRSIKRKSNNLWTLDEIVTLVDGLSQFGLGQWTAVKRHYFKSSYRTSTDIRDKWRNLVKTHCRNIKSKREHHKSTTHPLPDAVIECVRELVAHSNQRYGSKSPSMLARMS